MVSEHAARSPVFHRSESGPKRLRSDELLKRGSDRFAVAGEH